MNKHVSTALLLTVLLAGCATSRNYQPDIDSLNAKVDSLQEQLQAKNKEIGALHDQIRSLEEQLEAANRDKMAAERRASSATQAKKTSGYDKQSTSSAPATSYAK